MQEVEDFDLGDWEIIDENKRWIVWENFEESPGM